MTDGVSSLPLQPTDAPQSIAGIAKRRTALRTYGPALALGVAFVAAYVSLAAPITYIFRETDSAHYLEAARSLLAGRGLKMSTDAVALPVTQAPLSLWPPAYPIAIALFSKLLGVSPSTVAPAIDWACWALLPVALAMALRRLVSPGAILMLAAGTLMAPGLLEFGWQPLSDAPFLLVTVLSLGLIFQAPAGQQGLSLIVLSGLLAGLAYALRNVGLAIFPAVGAAFGLSVVLKLSSLKAAAARIGAWGAGALVVLAPLLIRNVLVFGALQPYGMARSHLGLVSNIRYFEAAFLNNLVAVHGLSGRVVWSDIVIFGAPLALAGLLLLRRRLVARIFAELTPEQRLAVGVLGVYVLAQAAVIILARTRYEWREFIGLRHVLQIDWAVLALGALFIDKWRPRAAEAVAIALCVVALVGLRISYAVGELRLEAQELAAAAHPAGLSVGSGPSAPYPFQLAVKLAIARDGALVSSVRNLSADAVIVSNYADVLQIQAGRPVNPLPLGPGCDLRATLDALPAPARSVRPVTYLLFPQRELLKDGCWASLARQAQGSVALPIERPYLISFQGEMGQDVNRIQAIVHGRAVSTK